MIDPHELIVDNFAGGGGASTGIMQATGRSPDIAINHDAAAIAMHEANHPGTKHYQESVWRVDPVKACAGRPVGLVWLSPDCTHFSKAKGTAPVKKKIRGLAWLAVRWARAVQPRVMILENVAEFLTWGPLLGDRPDPARAGQTFERWLRSLQKLGYCVSARVLTAADYGAPTTRRRLFLVAHRDGRRAEWPMPTHGPGCAHPWRPASDIIDWSLPCRSIFGRDRPLAEATLNRIKEGVLRYVLGGSCRPFIVRHGHYSTITGAGLRPGCGAGTFRGQSLDAPLGTVCATNDKHLVAASITKHYGGVVGHDLNATLGTITARDHHALTQAVFSSPGQDPRNRLEVQRLLGREAILVIDGVFYEVTDIVTRMLQPKELFAAQGFPSSYIIDPLLNGKPLNKTQQIRLAGNSVCPQVAKAIVELNLASLLRVAA